MIPIDELQEAKSLDPRVCVTMDVDTGNTKIAWDDLPMPANLFAREILARIVFVLRRSDVMRADPGPRTSNSIVEIRYMPYIEGEDRKVCVAYNVFTQEIQVSVNGMDPMRACMACDNGIVLIDALRVNEGKVE